MNLHHLKVFQAVAEAGSISAGAERLHISQPAVTREIRQLEARMGVRLFERKPRGVKLTEGGERLIQYAKRIFALEQAAERDLQNFVRLESGELHLGASATLGAYLLPPLINRFRQASPRIRINLSVSNTGQVCHLLDDGLISLGFVEGAFDHQQYSSHLIARDALLPVVATRHPLSAYDTLQAADLQAFPLYMREPGSGTRHSIEQAYRACGLEPHSQIDIGNTEALKALLDDGCGVAWLSRHSINKELAEGSLICLPVRDLHIEREFYALWRNDLSLSPAASAFLSLCTELDSNIKTF